MRRRARCALLALALVSGCGVGSREAGDPRPEHGPTTTSPTSDPGVPTTDGTASTASADAIMLDDDTPLRSVDCAGQTVVIATSGGVVNLDGDCPSVLIEGSGNIVSVERVGAFMFTGDNNFVNWSQSLSGGQPDVDDAGTFNVVTQG